MEKDVLHRPALEALLALATSDVRWRSRAQLAAEAGVTPSTFSDAMSGRRNLSDEAISGLCSVLPGCTREALILPVLARPGDLETVRLVAELKRLRADTNRALDDIAGAIRERSNGG